MAVYETGPNDIFARLREMTGVEYDEAGHAVSWPPWNPLHCVLCTSLYTAFIMVFAPTWARRTLAVAAIASLVQAALKEVPLDGE